MDSGVSWLPAGLVQAADFHLDVRVLEGVIFINVMQIPYIQRDLALKTQFPWADHKKNINTH